MIRYVETNSIIHRSNAFMKYLIEVILIFSLPFLSPYKYLFLMILLWILIHFSKISFIYFHKNIKFILFFSFFIIPISFLYPDSTIITGLLIMLRIYLIFGYAFLVIITTRMIKLVSIFFQLFNKLFSKKTTLKLTFIVLLIVKFIPILLKEIDKIFLSMKTRGLNLKKGKLKDKVTFLKIFILALIRKIENLTDEYEIVLHSRSIGYANIKNLDMTIKLKIYEIFFILVFIFFIFI